MREQKQGGKAMVEFCRRDQQPKKFESAKAALQLVPLARQEAVADLKAAGFAVLPVYRVPA